MLSDVVNNSCLFLSVSIIVSLYYAVRGWLYEYYDPYIKLAENKEWKRWHKLALLHLHGSIYNFVSAMAGFYALKLMLRILESIPNLADIGVGTAAFLSFLVLVAILGISGVLPRFLWKGALIGSKG